MKKIIFFLIFSLGFYQGAFADTFDVYSGSVSKVSYITSPTPFTGSNNFTGTFVSSSELLKNNYIKGMNCVIFGGYTLSDYFKISISNTSLNPSTWNSLFNGYSTFRKLSIDTFYIPIDVNFTGTGQINYKIIYTASGSIPATSINCGIMYTSSNNSIDLSSSNSSSMPFPVTYSGSSSFNEIAILRPDGSIGLNKDLKVHQDWFMYVIIFPLLGLFVFWGLIKWMFGKK